MLNSVTPSPGQCARTLGNPTPRLCDLFEFAELSPSQKVVVLLRALTYENVHLIYQEMEAIHLSRLTRQQVILPRATPALQAVILSEYLGLEQSAICSLPRLVNCLNTYAEREPKTLCAELTALLVGDWEAEQSDFGETNLFFFRDLGHHHKCAILLCLTNMLDDPRLRDWLPGDSYTYTLATRPILDNLRLMTKLRVVREFLEVPLEKIPDPDSASEFTRLSVALTKVCEYAPEHFVQKLTER